VPREIPELTAGKASADLEFVVSNRSGTAEQIHFSVVSRDQKAISNDNDHLNLSRDGYAWHLKITPNDGAVGQVGLEAVAVDSQGMSVSNDFQVTLAVPTGLFRNSLGMDFVWVDNLPGTEQATWDSSHAHGGWVAKYLVTQKDFSAVMQANPSAYKGGDPCPVENMTAAQVDEFCHKLPPQDQGGRPIPAGWAYQLLTIDQWKFCAANYKEADCVLKKDHPEPVGSLGANPLGLFDIVGNVYEVVTDSNKTKWASGASFAQARASKTPGNFTPSIWAGFRLAITPTVPTP